MNAERLIWTILLVVGVGWIAFRTAQGNMGKTYTKEVPTQVTPKSGPDEGREIAGRPDLVETSPAKDPQAKLDGWRTLGLWVGALLTLFLFSFMYRDNPFYKIAESILVGASAAYWMVVAFWEVVIPNLLGKLWPALAKDIFVPGLEVEDDLLYRLSYLIPLILGIMLLWRLMPKGGWISRWPLAFIMGTTAGLRLLAHLQADCMSQVTNSIYPLWAKVGGEFDFWVTLQNWVIVIGVLSGLVYFFFSFEHKGLVGRVARLVSGF